VNKIKFDKDSRQIVGKYLSKLVFNHFAAAEPSANVYVACRTLRNDPSVYIATTA